jgi:hypothetical protein
MNKYEAIVVCMALGAVAVGVVALFATLAVGVHP